MVRNSLSSLRFTLPGPITLVIVVIAWFALLEVFLGINWFYWRRRLSLGHSTHQYLPAESPVHDIFGCRCKVSHPWQLIIQISTIPGVPVTSLLAG